MENDTQLMCTMAKGMLFLLKTKHENKLKSGLMTQEKKAITFTFMVKETEL
jgi:hypothetical protein